MQCELPRAAPPSSRANSSQIITRIPNQPPGIPFGPDACVLTGISLSGGRNLANLGSILVAGIAILVTLFMLWRTDRKAAAVGRREIQMFLLGYLVIEVCEIFTVGGFPLDNDVRKGFTAVHIAAIVATTWILLMNAAVGYQLIDDGTPVSLALIGGTALAFFIGTGYICLDTAFSWTGFWDSTLDEPRHRSYALYTLYQLAPLVFLFFFFVLESVLVLRVLGERKPMIYLVAAMLLFAIGQVFNYVISVHICKPANGQIDGAFFETLFTFLSVIMIWIFWSSITEDDWPITA
jgi:hypothetical protein